MGDGLKRLLAGGGRINNKENFLVGSHESKGRRKHHRGRKARTQQEDGGRRRKSKYALLFFMLRLPSVRSKDAGQAKSIPNHRGASDSLRILLVEIAMNGTCFIFTKNSDGVFSCLRSSLESGNAHLLKGDS